MTAESGSVPNRELMERLTQHQQLGDAPTSEREWLVRHGELSVSEVGTVVAAKGQQVHMLMIVFSGRLVLRTDRGAGAHKIAEWRAGDVGGAMPYSRGASPPSDAIVEEPLEMLTVKQELFAEMIRECPVVTTRLVHVMLDRVRQFNASEIRDEKLVSLGKLAAGLAHELNNPSSAVVRSSKMLTSALGSAETAARLLAASGLSESQFAAVEAARTICGSPLGAGRAGLSSIARADHEDAVTEWLESHDVPDDVGTTLADTGVTLEVLDELAKHVSGDALEASVRWLAACCLVRALSSEIESSATRIFDLVSAVKGFSYMDHAPTPEPVDIRRGIADALTMLASKTRSRSVEASIEIPDNLPRAYAVGAELNQVWLNLIDNAVDAVPNGGHVAVSARRELDCIVVSITDDGPGIPADIQLRIFDPFFTTKGVGKGTGLGLDIVRRLLQRHNGEVSVESVPGRTEFQVRLPLEK